MPSSGRRSLNDDRIDRPRSSDWDRPAADALAGSAASSVLTTERGRRVPRGGTAAPRTRPRSGATEPASTSSSVVAGETGCGHDFGAIQLDFALSLLRQAAGASYS